MGVVLGIPKQKTKNQIQKWVLHYAVNKKDSATEAQKFLKKKVPQQLWYQVQKSAKEQYNV